MELKLTIDFDFKPLQNALPKLIATRMNSDMELVEGYIDKGIKTSISPVNEKPYKPISEVTKLVRKMRRQTKSKDKPLVASGRMSKLKRKKATQRGELKFYGYIEMGAPYGVHHLKDRITATNFSVQGRRRSSSTEVGTAKVKTFTRQGSKKKPKGTFFKVKGKRVPARVWFGIPKRFTQKRNFNMFMTQMKRKLKEGDKIIKQPMGSIKLG